MNQAVVKTFTFENEEYEIRTYATGWDITVKTFKNGVPANGYSYSVSLPTAFDLRTMNGSGAVQELFRNAEEDVKNKLWDKYVVAYLASLKTTEDSQVGCRKCTSRDILSSKVDERKMFECQSCKNVWYDKRETTNAYCLVVDSITDEVSEKGSYEVDAEILLNTIFRNSDKTGLSFEDQLKNWANINRLKYEHFQKTKNDETLSYIRFWR